MLRLIAGGYPKNEFRSTVWFTFRGNPLTVLAAVLFGSYRLPGSVEYVENIVYCLEHIAITGAHALVRRLDRELISASRIPDRQARTSRSNRGLESWAEFQATQTIEAHQEKGTYGCFNQPDRRY